MFRVPFKIMKATEGKDGEFVIRGVASDTSVDRDEEKFSIEAVQKMKDNIKTKKIPLRVEHQSTWNMVTGYVKDAELIGDKLVIEAVIDKGMSIGKDFIHICKKASEGLAEMPQFSVQGTILDAGFEYVKEIGKNILVYKDIVLEEISLVSKPSNKNVTLDIVSFAKSIDLEAVKKNKKDIQSKISKQIKQEFEKNKLIYINNNEIEEESPDNSLAGSNSPNEEKIFSKEDFPFEVGVLDSYAGMLEIQQNKSEFLHKSLSDYYYTLMTVLADIRISDIIKQRALGEFQNLLQQTAVNVDYVNEPLEDTYVTEVEKATSNTSLEKAYTDFLNYLKEFNMTKKSLSPVDEFLNTFSKEETVDTNDSTETVEDKGEESTEEVTTSENKEEEVKEDVSAETDEASKTEEETNSESSTEESFEKSDTEENSEETSEEDSKESEGEEETSEEESEEETEESNKSEEESEESETESEEELPKEEVQKSESMEKTLKTIAKALKYVDDKVSKSESVNKKDFEALSKTVEKATTLLEALASAPLARKSVASYSAIEKVMKSQNRDEAAMGFQELLDANLEVTKNFQEAYKAAKTGTLLKQD